MVLSATATKPAVRPNTPADATTATKQSNNGWLGSRQTVATATAIVASPIRNSGCQDRASMIHWSIRQPISDWRRPHDNNSADQFVSDLRETHKASSRLFRTPVRLQSRTRFVGFSEI